MPTYLSPGVFPQEISAGVLPSSVGPLRPVFIGTANKGPLNRPTLVTSPQQAIDLFGEPFPESYLMYAVLAFFEEGSECYVVRVGVRCEEGQDEELDDICIDDSGNKESGWGRVPVFTGIDFGRISLRAITANNPATFHDASVVNIDYNDAALNDTDGPTTATLNITDDSAYTGCVDDSYVVLVTNDPDDDEPVVGATFEVIRNSDGEVVAEGVFEGTGGTGDSQLIDIGDGLEIEVVVTAGRLAINDTFTFSAIANNRTFSVSVEGGAVTDYEMPVASYTDVDSFVVALNGLLSGEDYLAVSHNTIDGITIAQLRTSTAGERIQLMGGCAFAKEMGTEQYAFDIPRSYLIGTNSGPYTIVSANNRIRLNVIGTESTESIELTLPSGTSVSAVQIAAHIDAAGTVSSEELLNSFAITIPGGTEHVVIVASSDHRFDQIALLATFTYIKTLRFAEELGISHPYTRSYRGFRSFSLYLPDSGLNDASIPLSCEVDEFSATCAEDTAYFENIVGWFVAPSPGTWCSAYSITLENFTEGVGDTAGRYKVIVKDNQGVVVDTISDVRFDPEATRYIGNVVNPGSSLGGVNGNAFINWEQKPDYVSEDVRLPAQFNDRVFDGTANGIPTDAALSTALDAAVIGRQSDSSGLYGIANSETLDINLVSVPGFSSGAVIGQALQICESRGDCLLLVDPPFGLRPQQVVDWHNGMLTSDLTSAINSSYGALYYSWIKIFDQFSNERIWVPPSGHVAAVFSRTARVAEQWSAPAGLNRGRLLTATDIEYDLTNGDRNLLYGSGNAINPITKLAQTGIVVYGQRTLQRTDSATDRVNVRMLLSHLKKNTVRSLRSFIFEPNDRITRAQVKSAMDGLMSDVQARRGVDAFLVVCDESNNTPERIARHELWVSIFFRPTSIAEFVVLNLVTLQTSASFSADEVLIAGGVVLNNG